MSLSSLFMDLARHGAEWVLWLLLVLSVVSFGIMFDRARWLRGRDARTDEFLAELRAAAAAGDAALDEVAGRHADAPSIPVQVARAGLATRRHGAAACAESMLAARARWRRAGDRHLIVLGTLGNNVPFVGLFGTVLGVIAAFDDLRSKSEAGEAAAMAGVAEALIATAVGLLVAIPAVVAFNYFGRRLRTAMAGADEAAHTVLAIVHGAHAGPAGAAEPPAP
jgi:biopolymer transport protein ExbB/TolQ